MKKIILILTVALISTAAMAQKYGHLNAQEIMKAMPEYIQAQAEMENYGKQKEKELVTMQKAFQESYQKYEAQASTLSPEIRKSRESDLLETQQSIQAFQQKAQEKIQKKEVELLDPMIKRVRAAIKVVGKANGFTYIFDESAGSLLYSEGGNDVSELVKAELAKKPKVAAGK